MFFKKCKTCERTTPETKVGKHVDVMNTTVPTTTFFTSASEFAMKFPSHASFKVMQTVTSKCDTRKSRVEITLYKTNEIAVISGIDESWKQNIKT